jgi:hypothetical protein
MELIVCGWDEVFVVDPDAGAAAGRKLWSWRAADCPSLPDEYRTLFGSTDDCKPVAGGRRVLISSSGGGAALVERATGGASFCGQLVNAHSIEMLPGGRIAVAGSNTPDGDGLLVFEQGLPGRRLWSGRLPWGHGLVWDAARELLWALSIDHVQAYRLTNWDSGRPELAVAAAWELPDHWGHDLFPAGDGANLTVTTRDHCWLFDRDAGTFAPDPDLADEPGVKCISTDPSTGRIAWVQAEAGEWWAPRIRFLKPPGELHMPGEKVYKVRWAHNLEG